MRIILLLCIMLFSLLFLSCDKKTTEPENSQTVSTPTFNPPGGNYTSPQTVTISCATVGATIRYTTDGSVPSDSSALYSAPVIVASTKTLKAKAFKEGWYNSQIASASYSILVSPPEMILVQGGSFQMGSNTGYSNELPVHSVTLSTFLIGKYEVTQGEWQSVMGSNPAHDYGMGANYPVYYVSWYAVMVYCNKRSLQEGYTPCYSINGQTNPVNWGDIPPSTNSIWDAVVCNWSANGYRLPTEAEWEYSARGGNQSQGYTYSGSNVLGDVAWYYDNSSGLGSSHPDYGTHSVGTKAPNELGIHDMSGNVREWCWDWNADYSSGSQSNPTGPANGPFRVRRGGSCDGGDDLCRVANRDGDDYPLFSYGYTGFRLSRTIP